MTAVIPTWNRVDLLRSILRNLQEQSRPPDRILVIDNGSTDGSGDLAKSQGAEVIRFEDNRGFAVAVNEGILHANSDYVFIVNNDVVLRPDWLQLAMHVAESKDAPFICGKLLRPGGNELDGSFDLVSRAVYAWRCGYGKPDGLPWSQQRGIFWAPMTAAMFHRRVFEQVGLLDTRFESYYEDVEFGIRCALAGLEGVYEPRVVATHMSKTTLGKSSRRVYFNSSRNQIYILSRHFPSATLRRFAWPILAGQTLSLLAAARQRNFLAALQGKWAGWRAWKTMRGSFKPGTDRAIEAVLSRSEREIAVLQKQIGPDIYWKLYFQVVKP